MAIRKFRAGQSSYSADTYVGTRGTLFYDEDTGELRLSDGVTPGGIAIPITLATTSIAGSLRPGSGFAIGSNGLLSLNAGPMFELDENQVFQLKPGTADVIGGIRPGPGVVINSEGQLLIDTAGLDFSFGDFFAFTNLGSEDGACLSSINTNQDIVLVSNGTGSICTVGSFHIHKSGPDLNDALKAGPIFSVADDGQIKMLVPGIDAAEGAVSIIGSASGTYLAPENPGVMLHITGNGSSPGIPSRIYNDSQNAFAAYVARRLNGTVASPTAVLDGEELSRITATAHNGTAFPTASGQRISYRALGNQTLSNGGGAIEFWTTPVNTTTIAKVASIDNANGITSTKFVGPLTGSVKSTTTDNTILDTSTSTAVFTGNVTGNVSGTAPAGLLTGTALASNVVTSSLTAVGALTSGSIGAGFTAIANARLANSTISGIALGNNLAALTIGTHLTGTSYNGSTGITIATNATTDATASVLVARDSNGLITAQNYKGNTRDAGTIGAGGTLTINYATDHHVLVNITGAITIAHQNITAGRNVKVVIINATGTNLAVNTGVSDQNTTSGNNDANLNATRMGVYEYISYGTTTATLYANVNK